MGKGERGGFLMSGYGHDCRWAEDGVFFSNTRVYSARFFFLEKKIKARARARDGAHGDYAPATR